MKKTLQRPAEERKRSPRKKEPSGASMKKNAPAAEKRAVIRKKEAVPLQKVEFVFSGIESRQVFLCGDFNSWDSRSLPLEKNQQGEWEAVVSLAPGRYEFKALGDGAWIESSGCKIRLEGTDFTLSLPTESVFNSLGTRNLAVTVR